jgi:hypothetical protein
MSAITVQLTLKAVRKDSVSTPISQAHVSKALGPHRAGVLQL